MAVYGLFQARINVITFGAKIWADWYVGGLVNNYRMVRNPDAGENSPRCIFRGDPPTYAENEFIAVPVKRGKMAVLNACVNLLTYRKPGADRRAGGA